MAALMELLPAVAEQKIKVQSVTKEYALPGGEVMCALQDVDLQVRRGEFLCIVGPSGCGKSTLLHIIAGLVPPTRGEVSMDGGLSNGPGPDSILIFQELGLFPWLTVLENVEFGLKMQGMPARERRELSRHFLSLVRLSRFEQGFLHQLSGGMKRRLSLARALVLSPSVLLMDEPFTAMDTQTRDLLHDELERLWIATRQTIILVTHNVHEAVRLGDRVMVMSHCPGRIKQEFTISLGRSRHPEDPDVALQAREILAELRGDIDQGVRAEYREK